MKIRNIYEDTEEKWLAHELMSIFVKYGFETAPAPTILEVDDEPCPNENLKKIEEGNYDIDDFLGLYVWRSNEIKLFTNCIEAVAKNLNIKAIDLKNVVLLHEWGHWITHRLPYNGRVWENYPGTGAKEDKDTDNVHEGLAQLLAWWVAKKHPELKKSFETLNVKQSPVYQVFKKFINYEQADICKSLPALRNSVKITYEGWEKEIIKVMPSERRGQKLTSELGIS